MAEWFTQGPYGCESAAGFARQNQAQLAAGRRAASGDSPWSLSPAALRRAPFTPGLVLPSPNGSAICAAAASGPAAVIAACLRNAGAAGAWVARHSLGSPERPAAVIAAGERWPDGSLRPALEDLLGAGAVIAALHGRGCGPLSPEAEAARTCYERTADPARAVRDCASGRELAGTGFADDVAVATEIDACRVTVVVNFTGSAAWTRWPAGIVTSSQSGQSGHVRELALVEVAGRPGRVPSRAGTRPGG